MLHLVGFRDIIKTIATLARPYHGGDLKDLWQLKVALGRFLDNCQPDVPHIPFSKILVSENSREEALVKSYQTTAILDDRDQSSMLGSPYSVKERQRAETALEAAIGAMKSHHPELSALFELVIHSIFLRKSSGAGGGSTSNAVGVIWVNCRDDWSRQDFEELLIHELTHNLVFLDELRHLHFADYKLIAQPQNYARSAILATQRPLDKVFHSIIVAVELIHARRNFLGEPSSPKVHPPTERMVECTLAALDSIYASPNVTALLTKRGHYLMEACRDNLAQLARDRGAATQVLAPQTSPQPMAAA
ncbi:aKG-HExxH-type peptide beta-hydroxylase [Sorangium sp. So ce426]|uniref:aKG-HExxH-type peptide beta-hydroxylase n=1 Tax=unclassified Sorangium TaxID=2621164 RepID=UPI003F5B4440